MLESQGLIFEPFRLDLRDERLWRGTEAIRIGAKAFGVLRCLATQANQLVTKDALLETVWPEAAVGEAVITVVIRELRQALGDPARAPRFIETVRGRGYRFIAPVARVEAPADPPNANAPASPGFTDASEIFVGRATELVQLDQWLTAALQGHRQVGFVAGDPGIGKTALVDTFIARLEMSTEPLWVGRGQCVDHYGVGDAYLPILEALGRLCRGAQGASLIALLRQHAPSWLAQMPGLLAPEERDRLARAVNHVTPSGMIRELAEALEALTEARPLALVLEDMHWSDPSTLAFLSYAARRRDRARLLILATYRPVDIMMQAHPLSRALTELRQHRRCVEIALDDLLEVDVAAYLKQRFGVQRVAANLQELLHQRCGGNPLFLVAMVDELARQDILQKRADTLHILGGLSVIGRLAPPSVQQLIAQRVDQLSTAEQRLLEAASVAGMSFAVATLQAAVAHDGADIEAQLTTWSRQGRFVRANGVETWPDGVVSARYEFRHALYHDVILRRTSPGQSIHLNQAIGARKETAYADQTPLIAAELAAHFEVAQDFQRAVLYRQHAAGNALARSAYEEALAHLSRGLALLDALPDTPERSQQELALRLTLGTPLSVTNSYAAPEVERNYTRARQLHQQFGDAVQLPPEASQQLPSYLIRGAQFYLVRGDLKTAQEIAEQCLTLAGDDPAFRLTAHYAIMLSLFYRGQFTSAYDHAQQCIALYDPLQHHALASLYGYDLGVASQGYAAQALWMLGYPDQAQRRCQEALSLAQTLSHPFSEAFILGHLAVLSQFGRDGYAVCEHAQGLIAFCADKGFHQWIEMGVILQGWGLAMQGQGEVGIAQMQQGLASSGDAGIGLGRAPVMAQLAEAYRIAGQTDAGLRALEQARAAMEATGECWWAAETYRLQGELLLQTDAGQRHSEANPASRFRQAMAIARQQGAKSFELRAAIGLARLWQSQDKRQDAYDLLAPVYGWFTEGLDAADLQEGKLLLDELRGNQNSA